MSVTTLPTKLQDIKALLSSIDIEDSIDTLVYPLGGATHIETSNLISMMQTWLQTVVISELDTLAETDIDSIHAKLDEFINTSAGLTLQVNFKYADQYVVLVLLKVLENNSVKVLLNNLWLGKESIISLTVQHCLGVC